MMTQSGVDAQALIHTYGGLYEMGTFAKPGKAAREVPLACITNSPQEEPRLTSNSANIEALGLAPLLSILTIEGYEVRLTPDMMLMTSEGWMRASDLRANDRVAIANMPTNYHPEYGRAGVGWYGRRRNGRVIAEQIFSGVSTDALLREPQGEAIGSLIRASESMQRTFFQRLLDRQGEVLFLPYKHVRLSLPAALVSDIQIMLLNFGIASRVIGREVGSGLLLRGDNLIRLDDEFGFNDDEKDSALNQLIKSTTLEKEKFTAEVCGVVPCGEGEIYGVVESATNIFIINGFGMRNPD